jgi:polyisoprenoid-binding protein YceI
MKTAIFSALLLVRAVTQAAVASETYEINPENSAVLFKVRLLWTTNIQGATTTLGGPRVCMRAAERMPGGPSVRAHPAVTAGT